MSSALPLCNKGNAHRSKLLVGRRVDHVGAKIDARHIIGHTLKVVTREASSAQAGMTNSYPSESMR